MESLFTGSQIIEVQRTASSNNYALDLLKQGKIAEGAVIHAIEQLAGKGQRGSSWQSETGKNLTFSVIYHPSFLPADQQFLLNKAVSLAVKDFIASKAKGSQPVKIKWPNDIYVGDQKVAGILIENTIREKVIADSVIGIGININQENFSEELPNPVSLKMLTGKEYDTTVCLKEFCSFLEVRYMQLRNNVLEKLNQHYQESLYQLNDFASYEIKGEQVEAKITGTNQLGNLQLESKERVLYTCDLKEIKYL